MSNIAPGLLKQLVSYWPMGTSLVETKDLYGRNTMPFGVDPVPVTNGKITTANDFERDNDDSFGLSSNNSLKVNGTSFAVQAWVKLESAPNDMYIVAKWTSPSNLEYALIYSFTYGTFVFMLSTDGTFGGVTECIGAFSINTGEWYHVVGVFNFSTNDMQIYINNTVGTATSSGSVYSGSSVFYIGHDGNLGVGGFDGLICDVALWKRTLTGGEIKSLYNDGRGYYFLRPYSSISCF